MTTSPHRTQRPLAHKGLATFLAGILALWLLAPGGLILPEYAQATEPAASTSYADDEVIVVYEDGLPDMEAVSDVVEGTADESDLTEPEQALADLAITESQTIVDESDDASAVAVATLPDDTSVEEAIDALNDTPGIAYAQPNYRYELLETTTDDTRLDEQYHLDAAKVTDAWDSARCDGDVTVAVIDTGCNLEHEDLAGVIDQDLAWDATKNKPLSEANRDNHGDDNGHGTHVCGIVAAQTNNGVGVAGASYNANLIPIAVYDEDGNCSTKTITAAYQYLSGLMDAGTLDDLHVINISLGGYQEQHNDRLLHDAIAAMTDRDVLTVCAGGNGNGSTTPYTTPIYPGDFEECLSVTCLNQDGTNTRYSDYNDAKDLSTYGVKILSTGASGGYATKNGTSMASPLVAGAAALLWAAQPDLTVSQARAALEGTATALPEDSTREGKTGSKGCLDAQAAVQSVLAKTSLEGATISGVTDATYAGHAVTQDHLTVTLSGTTLEEGTDYELSYRDNDKAGTATVVVEGIGAYVGSVSATFEIARGAGSLAFSSKSLTKTYGAAAFTNSLKKTGDGSLKFSSSNTSVATVNASGAVTPKNVGTTTITATLTTGTNYQGATASYALTVLPKGTTITKLKAKRTSITVTWKKVTSSNSGYQIRYATKKDMSNAKTKTIASDQAKSKKLTKLKKKCRHYVQIRRYKVVNGHKYYSAWSKITSIKTL